MKYKEMRELIKTGDVVGVEGKRLFQMAIRKLTGQSLNHVGMFVWLSKGLYVFEFKGSGFQFTAASVWVKKHIKKDRLYWCSAPKKVSNYEYMILEYVTEVREGSKTDRSYNFWELPIIWISQYLNINVEAMSGVCSTSIATGWKRTGYEFKKMPRPGDFLFLAESVTPFKTNK